MWGGRHFSGPKKVPGLQESFAAVYLQALSSGQVLKRSTRADCKSAGYAFGGSNPSLPTTHSGADVASCGSNSVGRVTAFQAVGREFESRLPLEVFNPTGLAMCLARRVGVSSNRFVALVAIEKICGHCGRHADVAQLVEHHLGKVEVTGSIPVISSTATTKRV